MNKLKFSNLAVAFEHDRGSSIYNTEEEYLEKEIKTVFENLGRVQKGIEYKKHRESDEMILEIDNKYYTSQIKLNLINMNDSKQEIENIEQDKTDTDVEGLIVFWNSHKLGNVKVNYCFTLTENLRISKPS